MASKRWRVFIDTSALIAGLLSAKGAARQVLAAGEIGLLELLVSEDVLIEADRNIQRKFPRLLVDFRQFIQITKPTLVANPPLAEIHRVVHWIGMDDAPILAAALRAKADFLVTWNTRDFMGSKMPKTVGLKIETPSTFLIQWTDFIKEY